MKPIIEVNNIAKEYLIGERESYVAFRDVIMNILKFPFRLFSKNKKKKGKKSFMALDGINFEVKPGEVIGIIGKNGAGKSTLLKILSQITPPSKGSITLRGRVGSLLEVGTGFHPELTGRENIYLNGAILGMRKSEIKEKFDEIVAFSGVENFLDTPVKRYSSGMYVRLAFAVAAHLDPEILVVDEVLSVGDAEFQKKCLGKMKEVTNKGGRTVLFVSHNMGAIRNLCSRVVLLEDGKVKKIGDTHEVVNEYMAEGAELAEAHITDRQRIMGDKSAYITKLSVNSSKEKHATNIFSINEPIECNIHYTVEQKIDHISFFALVYDNDGRVLMSTFQKDVKCIDNPTVGEHTIQLLLDDPELLPGTYPISVGIFAHRGTGAKTDFADWVEHPLSITIADGFYNGKTFDQRLGLITKVSDWKEVS